MRTPALSVCAAAVSGGEVSVGCQASTTLGVCQRRPKTDPLATVVGGQFSPVADRRPAHSLLTDGAHTAGRPSTRLWQTVQVRRTEVDGSVRHGTSWWGSNPGALPAPDSGSEHRIN